MYRITTTTLAAAIALAIGGTAAAQQAGDSRTSDREYQSFQSSEHGRRADEEMRRLDTNRDQRIDENEAQADPELVAAWADLDLNRDGSLDATEYYLFAAQRTIAGHESESGAASQQERSASEQRGIGQQQQGAARQSSEQRSAAQQSSQRQQSQAGEQQRRAAEQQSQAGEQQRRAAEQRSTDDQQQRRAGAQEPRAAQQQAGEYPSFEEVDRNSDGRIGRTELARVEGLDFSEADSDQDGYLSRDEYREATQQ
jgi:hypothetical protein